jgi:LppX_LprAFG lipoprotein
VAAAALCAGALALMAGCSAGSSSSAGPAGTRGTAGTTAPVSAQEAISLAVKESRRVTSEAATFSEQVGSPMIATTAATMQLQLKPVLLVNESLHTTSNGQTNSVDEIVSAKAIYLKSSGLGAAKPWVEVPFSELSGSLGSAISSLLQSAQNGNAAEQTQVLAASKDVHAVGTQEVNGVETTHYTGTVSVPAALARLSPSVRKGFAPVLKLITGDIRFDVWIDAQHVTRRLVENETVEGEPVTVTVNVTAVNQPVQIAVPPASQVTILPASQLGGL